MYSDDPYPFPIAHKRDGTPIWFIPDEWLLKIGSRFVKPDWQRDTVNRGYNVPDDQINERRRALLQQAREEGKMREAERRGLK